ncbi:YrpD family protein [Paenibacillus typhae]
MENKIGISQDVIDGFITEASNEIQKEKLTKSLKGVAALTTERTYDYISVQDDGYYFYEEDASHEKKAFFVPIDRSLSSIESTPVKSSVSENVYKLQNIATPFAQVDLPDGIGGRQYIVKRGSYISTSATIAAPSQVSRDSGENAYTYTGFMAGANSADMGLMYDSNVGIGSAEQGWKPTIQINGITTNSSLISPYNQVQASNAYMAGSQVTFYAWYNYEKKIRMKVDGTAICADLGCGRSADTPLTTIVTSNTAYDIQPSSFQKWKVLAVVTGDDIGKNKSVFSNIKVDGVAVPSSAFPTPDEDGATVTRDANNNVTITVTGK